VVAGGCRYRGYLAGLLPSAATELDDIALPPGFRVAVYAEVPNARQMALGPPGVLFVGSRDAGRVHAVVDRDGDGRADAVHLIASGLAQPSGVAFRDGALYVAEVNRIGRYDRIEESLDAPPEPVLLRDDLPAERHHGWKFIAFGPDGWLYVPVGAPCNVCDRSRGAGPAKGDDGHELPEDDRYASILRMSPDGRQLEIVARGVRNTVGFDWHPETEHLWFTDNGRDWLGDDEPPDELNVAPKAGLHFGFPYCHAGTLLDPEFGKGRSCGDYVAPARRLGPHVAALGMRFYTGSLFPASYRGHIFIAEHGSWNRTERLGYRVMQVRVEDGRAVSYEPFVEGWLRDGEPWGRPVDVLQMPDGALLVSDDFADVVYRISYSGDAVP
jgi:glucose/arabinose dehydrogenase